MIKACGTDSATTTSVSPTHTYFNRREVTKPGNVLVLDEDITLHFERDDRGRVIVRIRADRYIAIRRVKCAKRRMVGPQEVA